jgi:hypothetical protein
MTLVEEVFAPMAETGRLAELLAFIVDARDDLVGCRLRIVVGDVLPDGEGVGFGLGG